MRGRASPACSSFRFGAAGLPICRGELLELSGPVRRRSSIRFDGTGVAPGSPEPGSPRRHMNPPAPCPKACRRTPRRPPSVRRPCRRRGAAEGEAGRAPSGTTGTWWTVCRGGVEWREKVDAAHGGLFQLIKVLDRWAWMTPPGCGRWVVTCSAPCSPDAAFVWADGLGGRQTGGSGRPLFRGRSSVGLCYILRAYASRYSSPL